MDSFLALLGIVSEVGKGMYVVKAILTTREKYNVVHKHTHTQQSMTPAIRNKEHFCDGFPCKIQVLSINVKSVTENHLIFG